MGAVSVDLSIFHKNNVIRMVFDGPVECVTTASGINTGFGTNVSFSSITSNTDKTEWSLTLPVSEIHAPAVLWFAAFTGSNGNRVQGNYGRGDVSMFSYGYLVDVGLAELSFDSPAGSELESISRITVSADDVMNLLRDGAHVTLMDMHGSVVYTFDDNKIEFNGNKAVLVADPVFATPGSYVLNATKGKKERVGRILQMHANKRAELDKVYSGDIAAAVGFKLTTTGDTICDEQHPVILESMEFPEPVIELAIEPKTKAGQGKMGEALAKLAEEDPTFKAHTDHETGQTIIAGMGELHLEIIVDRLLREFKVEANVGAPQVAYKETFTKPVDQEYKYAKQSGGRGQYGHCKVKFEPMDPNGEETFKYESSVVGGAIPKEYIPAVGEGIEEAAKAGILGGFPVLGVHANVYDGSYHEVDSSEMAFHIAGSMCFKEAMKKANAVLLEPIMKVEVIMPEEYMGDVIGDINSRRGRIEGMEDIGGGKMVKGYVPLAEMFGYSTDLRSKTQGRGNYSMFFEKYEQVPKSVQEKVLAAKSK